MSTTKAYEGVRIFDMPDLGAVSDTSAIVGERAGSGLFSAPAMRTYMSAIVAGNLEAETAARIAGDAAVAAKATQFVNSIGALRALSVAHACVVVLGYYAPGDGGGGTYALGPSAPDNGGSIIVSSGGTYYLTIGAAVTVKQFGAKGDGATDDRAAIQTALDNSLIVYFPPGTYPVSASITLRSGQVVTGAGASSIVLGNAAGASIFIMTNTRDIVISDLTFDARAANMLGVAMTLGENNRIEWCNLRGCGITIDRGHGATIRDCSATPSSTQICGQILITGTESDHVYDTTLDNYSCTSVPFGGGPAGIAQQAIVLNRAIRCYLTKCRSADLGQPTPGVVDFITLQGDTQGCHLSDCVSFNAQSGLVLTPGTATPAPPSFNIVTNFDADLFYKYGIALLGTAGTNCLFNTFNGGMLTGKGSAACCGVRIQNSEHTIVTNMTISNFESTGGLGFEFSECGFNVIKNNIIDQVAVGVSIAGGVGTTHFEGNQFSATATVIAGAIDSAAGNHFTDNFGLNPYPAGQPALPATGVAYVNNTGGNRRISIFNGTGVTSVQVDGSILGIASGQAVIGIVELGVGESIAIFYTTTPSWFWMPIL